MRSNKESLTAITTSMFEHGHALSRLFSQKFATDESSIQDKAHFHIPVYRSLKSLVINCDVVSSTMTCKGDRAFDHTRGSYVSPSLVKALQALLLRGSIPKAQRLWVLDHQDHDESDHSVYNVWNRRDIINQKTWKLPWEYLPNRSKAVSERLITRTPEGEWIMTSPRAHVFIAEAQTWKETITGSRLPGAELGTVKEHAVKSSATSLSEHREKICFKGSCNFWSEERKTGMRLIRAEEREGLEDMSPVREMTPSDWKREIDNEDGTILWLIRDGN